MNMREFLINNDVYPNLTGYNFLIRAVEIIKKRKILITKELYPQIAKEYNTTASRVERAIRHIIASKLTFSSFIKIGMNKKPSNGELICYFAAMQEDK